MDDPAPNVAPGAVPPYGIAADKGSRDKPEFYVRRGSSAYPALRPHATAAVMVRAVRGRRPQPGSRRSA